MWLSKMSSTNERKTYRVDLAYAGILGLTVIVTAWCGLQHELWSSTLTFELKEANTAHREFTMNELKERQETILDVITFTGYLESKYDGNLELSEHYKKNFSPEMKQVFDKWLESDPFNNPDSTPPYLMPEYQKAEMVKAEESLKIAEEKSQNADRISIIASNYVFFTTIYAGISFLEGIGRVFPTKNIQTIFLMLGIILFSITTMILFMTMPIAPL